MKILVTGANGYLGLGIVKQLLDDGNEVVAADTAVDRLDERAVKVNAIYFQLKIHMSILGNQMWFYIWRGKMDSFIIQIAILIICRYIINFF